MFDDEKKANIIFNLMQTSITLLSNMKIVHKHLEILKQPNTENGFTCVLLLDESHMTAHAYTDNDKAMLAMDLFTCGNTDTQKICDYIISSIKIMFPNIINNNYKINKRFLKSK
jgi:S-adenosylmethionine/arginine decarboxylase-like enzyme